MKISRGKVKKDVGHGGLDEWFSGHGQGKDKSEGEARWGDWVAISPVKKKIKKELADGTMKKETVYPGDIVGPCGISEDPNWKDLTNKGKDPLKCMPRQKAYDMPKEERAELAREKMRAEKKDRGEGKSTTHTRTFEKESSMVLAGENEPTNPKLWEKAKNKAKSRYDKWPSAYAVGHALKIYKEEGGGWRKKAGWWESESGSLIGDGPADVMQEAVEEVREMYRSHPEINREPTLEELWGTVEFVSGPARDRGEISRRASFGKHKLPKLPYAYDALEPHISERTLRFHHDKHHKAYVDGLNEAERAIAAARKVGDFEAIPALNAAQAFNAGGHVLHTAYWESLTPDYKDPSKALVAAVERDFGSWDAFRSQMKESTVKVRGSGWGVLVLTPEGMRVLTVMNHENGVLWDGRILLPIDAWEHASYLDYPNDRAAHFDAVFDNLVDWSVVERRLGDARRGRRASDHRMRHRPDEGGPPAHDLVTQDIESPMPEDMLTHPERYTGSRNWVREFWPSLLKVQGKPNAPITIYRGLPSTAPAAFEAGDWVTLSQSAARRHVESHVPGGQVISAVVPAHTVVFAGDDLMEWGYWGPTVMATGAVRVAARREVDCHIDHHGLGDLVRGGSVTLYHGTTRQFRRFDAAHIRHDLINHFYKAPGIFLTPKKSVAVQYAGAARNAMIPVTVIDDLTRRNRGAGDVLGRMVREGRDAWEGLFEDATAQFPDAESPFDALEQLAGGVDPNTLMDIAEYFDGSKYAKGAADQTLFDLWGMTPTGTPAYIYDDMDAVGLDSSEYRPKVYTVSVSGMNRVLVTRSKSEAEKARSRGYDAVVFCGADLVDGIPEVVVFDPAKVRVTKVEVVDTTSTGGDYPYNMD